jgi:mRNA interferase RelE/StbE
MAPYRIEYARGVDKDVRCIPIKILDRIASAIDKFAVEPRPPSSIKLVGFESEYQIRVGDYRVIYQIHDSTLVILVIEIGHHKEISR